MSQRIRVVAAVVERDGKVLVCRRPAHKRHGGLWEFPGGKVEPGEDDLTALRRELIEELAVDVVAAGAETFCKDDDGSNFTIAFIPTSIVGDPQPLEHEAITWASPAELRTLAMAPTDAQYIEALCTSTSSD